MTIKNTHHQVSIETREQSLKLAKAIQRSGQTKEQTKLIAQGIQKGIDLYKKQQKIKARELDKKLKKASSQLEAGLHNQNASKNEIEQKVVYQKSMLPWVLLIITWCGILGYFFGRIL